MADDVAFSITTTRFDEHYTPAESSRITTNFANLARGEHREQNLRNTLTMIDRRFNDLMPCDNPTGDRYTLELEIVSVQLEFAAEGADQRFPLLEVLDIHVLDRLTGLRTQGIVGNNFSSYVRDYDFSVLLPAAAARAGEQAAGGAPAVPEDFGDLHGKLFDDFLASPVYRERFAQPPVICISVSTSKTYQRTENQHPVLGVEYLQNELSSTDHYFAKMGLQVRFFMPPNSVAPLAFYFRGDLLGDYSNLELIGTISTMETFQKIYRPEIYNANSAAGKRYQPSLNNQDYSVTQIVYDREERSQLAVKQGKFAEECFIKPYKSVLEQWASKFSH